MTGTLARDEIGRRPSAIGTVVMLSSSITTVAITIAMARVIADSFADNGIDSTDLTALIVLIALRAVLFMLSRPILAHSASTRTRILRRAAMATAIDQRNGTEVAPLIGPGIDALDDHFVDFVPTRIAAAVMPMIVLVVVAVIDPLTALILLFAGPMLVALLALIGLRTRDLAARRVAELGWLRSSFLDLVRGLPTLQVHGRADEMADTVRESSDRFASTTLDVLRTAFQTSLVIEWAATAATALVAVQIAFRLAGGHLEFTGALTALMLTPEFFVPWRELASRYHIGQHGAAVLEQLAEHDLDQLPAQRTIARSISGTPPRVEFSSVSFAHGDRTVLEEVSLVIEPGEIVAITGASGVGKSTIASLLLGLVRPDRGSISIDGRDLNDQGAPITRCAWVPQHAACFSGTVRSNVVIGRPDADDVAVWAALGLVDLASTIESLPSGLDTELGEGARRLSAGQRQRLAIARAIVAERDIEVLDEFTALLDRETERRVLEGVLRRPGLRTTMLIAHREASIDMADRVVVLVDGRLERVR